MDKWTGKKLGIYIIVSKTEDKTKDGHFLYNCKCIHCGLTSKKAPNSISRKTSKCSHIDKYGYPIVSCGDDNQINTRISNIFRSMKRRCFDKNDVNYKWYGGKGISICKEWLNNPSLFINWSRDNGYKRGLTIDRIDSMGNYEASNCKWIPIEENSRKAGKVNWITINGCTLTGRQWSLKIGKGINFINTLIRRNGIDYAIQYIKTKIQN